MRQRKMEEKTKKEREKERTRKDGDKKQTWLTWSRFSLSTRQESDLPSLQANPSIRPVSAPVALRKVAVPHSGQLSTHNGHRVPFICISLQCALTLVLNANLLDLLNRSISAPRASKKSSRSTWGSFSLGDFSNNVGDLSHESESFCSMSILLYNVSPGESSQLEISTMCLVHISNSMNQFIENNELHSVKTVSHSVGSTTAILRQCHILWKVQQLY